MGEKKNKLIQTFRLSSRKQSRVLSYPKIRGYRRKWLTDFWGNPKFFPHATLLSDFEQTHLEIPVSLEVTQSQLCKNTCSLDLAFTALSAFLYAEIMLSKLLSTCFSLRFLNAEPSALEIRSLSDQYCDVDRISFFPLLISNGGEELFPSEQPQCSYLFSEIREQKVLFKFQPVVLQREQTAFWRIN